MCCRHSCCCSHQQSLSQWNNIANILQYFVIIIVVVFVDELKNDEPKRKKRSREKSAAHHQKTTEKSPSFPSNQLRHQSSFHRFLLLFSLFGPFLSIAGCCCSNHFCFSVNNFRYRNYVYISFTCLIPAIHTTHNVHTKQSTIMKIEISTSQGNAHSTHSFQFTFIHTHTHIQDTNRSATKTMAKNERLRNSLRIWISTTTTKKK